MSLKYEPSSEPLHIYLVRESAEAAEELLEKPQGVGEGERRVLVSGLGLRAQ